MSRMPDIDAYQSSSKLDDAPPSRSFQCDLEINPIEFVRLLKKKRRLIAAVAVGVMTLTAVVMVLTPNRYCSSASILPSGSRDNLSGLMDLAGQFSVVGVGAPDQNSSALYPSILRSDLVRDGVLCKRYEIGSRRGRDVVLLADYFGTADPSELRAALSGVTAIGEDKKLGIIRLAVETTTPQLSQGIASEYLTQLETYLRLKRRSQARENESYLTEQQTSRGAELERAEDSLQQFMNVNRNWNTSSDPQLQTELARWKREIERHAKTYLLLSQQLELARLEAQKDIPIVRVLDEPSLPTQKSGPRRAFTTLLTGCLALLTTLTWLFVRDLWRQGAAAVGRDRATAPSDGTDSSQSRPVGILNLLRRSGKSSIKRTENEYPVEHE